jgi:hypothetical protein
MIAGMLMLLMASCTTTSVFPVSTVLPAAEAKASATQDKNLNYSIVFTTKHTAAPEKLVPARRAYVLWAETSENGIINLGRVQISKGLTGALHTTLPFRPIRLFVTAEDSHLITTPGAQVILNLTL